ncbi:MAG TPA: hypothetical protein PKW26_01505 [Treponemataceae bacterium]|jgi:hypothetical protein|nr:hypothetical protein [Treponemataceae bacterium]HPM06849.1 hypothetical protein [Treponemataceae bacterium]HPY53279.1 hypothetical protein [Treponemataceae bacterium]
MKKILALFVLLVLFFSCISQKQNNAELKEVAVKEELLQLDEDIPTSTAIDLDALSKEGIKIKGRVEKIVENEKTFSEVRYYVLITEKNTSLVLFNKKGFSEGFENYLDKEVFIEAYKDIGMIGFKREKQVGLFVLSIREED